MKKKDGIKLTKEQKRTYVLTNLANKALDREMDYLIMIDNEKDNHQWKQKRDTTSVGALF